MSILKYEIDLDDIRIKYLNGMKAKEIGNLYNCGETTIRDRLKSLNDERVDFKMKHKNIKYDIKPLCVKCNKRNQMPSKNGLCVKCSIRQRVNESLVECFTSDKEGVSGKNTIYLYENYGLMVIYSKSYKKYALVQIPLSEIGKIQKHTWHIHSNGYIECRINKKSILLHRFLLNVSDSRIVDHIDGNKFNNIFENLRFVTNSENQINKKMMDNNTSGITGITWDKSRDKWKVMISANGKNYNLGRFDNLEEAMTVRLSAEKIYHDEYIPIHRQ